MDQQGFSQMTSRELCWDQTSLTLSKELPLTKTLQKSRLGYAPENINSYIRCAPNPTGLFFLFKKPAAVQRLLKRGLIPPGTGPAQLPVTQPQARLALPGHSTTLSSLGSDISWWVTAWNTGTELAVCQGPSCSSCIWAILPWFWFQKGFLKLSH